jgi:hypothetical protein
MSYVFDTFSRAWARIRAALPETARGTEVTMRFEFLLEELHEANHRLKDAVNKDGRATRYAQRLDDAMHGADREPPQETSYLNLQAEALARLANDAEIDSIIAAGCDCEDVANDIVLDLLGSTNLQGRTRAALIREAGKRKAAKAAA